MSLELDAGDAVVFYSTLLHSANYDGRSPLASRRVVQLFDVARADGSLHDRVLHVPKPEGLDWVGDVMAFTTTSFARDFLKVGPNLRAASGYRAHWLGPCFLDYDVISGESFRERGELAHDWQAANRYVRTGATRMPELPPQASSWLHAFIYWP